RLTSKNVGCTHRCAPLFDWSWTVVLLARTSMPVIPSTYPQGAWYIGAPMIFGRLWEQTGCAAVIKHLAADRGFGFALERAVLSALTRIDPGLLI
ncbi:MAG TPA: hypothetical protein VKI44_03240, partial [Acetobacteraceae bacterium]|nr:hypothetical protein [Acetobacteraceae bacterium]